MSELAAMEPASSRERSAAALLVLAGIGAVWIGALALASQEIAATGLLLSRAAGVGLLVWSVWIVTA